MNIHPLYCFHLLPRLFLVVRGIFLPLPYVETDRPSLLRGGFSVHMCVFSGHSSSDQPESPPEPSISCCASERTLAESPPPRRCSSSTLRRFHPLLSGRMKTISLCISEGGAIRVLWPIFWALCWCHVTPWRGWINQKTMDSPPPRFCVCRSVVPGNMLEPCLCGEHSHARRTRWRRRWAMCVGGRRGKFGQK